MGWLAGRRNGIGPRLVHAGPASVMRSGEQVGPALPGLGRRNYAL